LASDLWIGDLVSLKHTLQELSLSHGTLTNVNDLAALTQLRVLDLSSCDELQDIAGIGTMALTELDISECYRICDFSVLKMLPALKGLNLCNTTFAEHTELSVLRNCTKLETLLVCDVVQEGFAPATCDSEVARSYDAMATQMIELLPHLSQMKHVYLGKGYATDAVLAVLGRACPKLETLDLSWAKFISDLSPIMSLPIKSLSLCGALAERAELWSRWLPQLAGLKESLTELDLSHNCTWREAYGLPRECDPPILPLASLVKLKTLFCEECAVLEQGVDIDQEWASKRSDEMIRLKALLPAVSFEASTLVVQLSSAERGEDALQCPVPPAPRTSARP
jgi:hypothetical protein